MSVDESLLCSFQVSYQITPILNTNWPFPCRSWNQRRRNKSTFTAVVLVPAGPSLLRGSRKSRMKQLRTSLCIAGSDADKQNFAISSRVSATLYSPKRFPNLAATSSISPTFATTLEPTGPILIIKYAYLRSCARYVNGPPFCSIFRVYTRLFLPLISPTTHGNEIRPKNWLDTQDESTKKWPECVSFGFGSPWFIQSGWYICGCLGCCALRKSGLCVMLLCLCSSTGRTAWLGFFCGNVWAMEHCEACTMTDEGRRG